ncbi:MAG: RnfABCDGE type electron transport complex subunit B [Pseudomonadota bacterium]
MISNRLNTSVVDTANPNDFTRQIDLNLPQTQCTQCDFPRCLDYAQAVADGRADINQCPPGGQVTISALAKLTKCPPKPLNPDNGQIEPRVQARIIESDCIGCRLCIKACPVDCIIGAAKVMHTVIAQDCTGCKLCVPVCPTDCIVLEPAVAQPGAPSQWPQFAQHEVERARMSTNQRLIRLARRENAKKQQKTVKARRDLKAEIQAALERKKASLPA